LMKSSKLLFLIETSGSFSTSRSGKDGAIW
jgi:hypothetical protein